MGVFFPLLLNNHQYQHLKVKQSNNTATLTGDQMSGTPPPPPLLIVVVNMWNNVAPTPN